MRFGLPDIKGLTQEMRDNFEELKRILAEIRDILVEIRDQRRLS